MAIHHTEPYSGELPTEYVLVNNGVDIQHKDMRQTKTWDGWDTLVANLDLPAVQVGTMHDPRIYGALDLRGKTSLLELFDLLQRSKVIVTTEGGIMHLSYALKCPNVYILRGPTRGKLFEYPGHRFIDSYICEICWSKTDDWYARCPDNVDASCMKSISPERVAMNLEEVLA
jgi:ADP-heptose:LPS heptosyltransferase